MLGFGLILFVLLIAAPLAWAALVQGTRPAHWSQARWDSAGLAPDPGTHTEAIVQIYSARTWGWKGIFAVHSWIVFKREDAPAYERFDVVGWGVSTGRPAVRRNIREVDGYWAGNRPVVVAELRGTAAADAIPQIEAAIRTYPFHDLYVTWPGPNSNSFVAWILRQVPGLRAELPALALGKDFLPLGQFLAATPSKTGFQLSLYGVLGVTMAMAEGFEVNFLGLVIGLDPADLAVKLPGVGRLSLRSSAVG